MSGVRQQNAAQIDGGRGCVDRSRETLLHQTRNPAGVIKMRVGQDDSVNLAGWNRQVLPVALAPLLLALEQPAIHQDLKSAFAALITTSVDQMFRSCNYSGGSQ